MAQADGSLARRVTNDRVGAENPTATPGLEWVAYTSNDPSSQGIFRVRADGTQPSPVVRGTYTNAEVSPDGRFVSFVETEDFGRRSYVRVAVFGTGARVPFEIRIQHPSLASALVFLGRHRWMPDGQAIAFVDLDERGRSGVWLQQFRPDRDTASTRKRLAGFFPQYATESFGISPDGTRIVLSTLELAENLMLAEDVPGVEPPRRSRP
jgi:Tol biopolymer transport system component